MIIKIPTNKLFFNNIWLQLVVVFTLIFLSYGAVWTRGGYADDFILLANSVQNDLLDSAKTWGNSRFASSITNWLVVRLLNSEALPADFAWTTIHSISFFSFALGAYFLNASLSVFRLGIEARWIAILIFILHPIKNQALLWPCAVFIYNVPFTIFLAATYYYLTKASSKNESIWSTLICFLAWLYSALSLEQFIPMLFVVVAIRMLFLPRTNRDVITTSAILLVITFIFAVSVMAGKSLSRLENFSLSDGDRFSHMVNTLMAIFSAYFIYPLKSALDPLFWHQFFNASVAVELVIGSLLLIWIAVFFIQKKRVF